MATAPLALTPDDIQAAAPGAAAPMVPTPAPEAGIPADGQAPDSGGYSGPGSNGSHPAAMLETLPADLLDNPLIFAVAKGQPGAVSAPDKSKDPVVKSVVKNAQALVAAGFGIYRSIDKKTAVLFNTQTMHPGDLEEADQQGRLLEIAPPFETVNSTAATAGAEVPIEGGAGTPPTAASIPASQPAASVQNKLATARTANIQPGTPTSGPAPGGGSILNSILKRTV
jgi:hypothetical protein